MKGEILNEYYVGNRRALGPAKRRRGVPAAAQKAMPEDLDFQIDCFICHRTLQDGTTLCEALNEKGWTEKWHKGWKRKVYRCPRHA